MDNIKSFQKNSNEASASIPSEVREKIIKADRNEKAKRISAFLYLEKLTLE